MMNKSDGAKPLTAREFEALCIQARNSTESADECSLLSSLCRALIADLGDPGLVCPAASEGTTALMDAILCDYLVHRYERENSFDPFPIIQRSLLGARPAERGDAVGESRD